ncbi:MAG: peptidase M14, partial [Anaerolineales bacterium]|nr:peptidase M14 [Anaerolineales bacterium]
MAIFILMAARLRRRWPAGWLLLAMALILTTGSSRASPARSGAESAVGLQTPALAGPGEPRVLVARVYFANRADRDRLAAVLDAVETATTAGYLTALISPAQYAALLRSGYRVEIDEARTALVNSPAAGLPEQAEGIPGYVCYRTVEETYADLAALAASHPRLAAWVDIGDSWEKVASGGSAGHDLHGLVITSQARPGPKPVFFLMAAIHAREYATAELAVRFAEYLVNGYGVDPDVTWLLDYFEVHVLPQANPDGRQLAETGLYHRKNTNNTAGSCSNTSYNHYGVDLNRNSSFHWGTAGVSADPCAQTYPGAGPASEPETSAIQAYVSSIFPDQRGPLPTDPAPAGASGVFISLHSYGRLVLFPWGDTNNPAPNDAALQTLGRKFGYLNAYSVCQSGPCLYATSGTTDDWAYAELGVAAYTFEVGTNFFESCAYFEDTLLPANLPALRFALKSARNPYQAPAGPDSLGVTTMLTTVVAGQAVTLTATADDTRSNSHGYGVEPVQPIAAARYTVDQP